MKNVLITGASRGIGESIAYYFAERGYYVVGTARSDFKFKENNFSGELHSIKLDVTDRDSIKKVYKTLKNVHKSAICGLIRETVFLLCKNRQF